MARMSRRGFLKLTAGGGGGIAAGIGLKKFGKLIPYVIAPEEIRPGTWTTYATTCRECPAGCGMHVRVIDGRVVKCEGNPNHPVSHGGLCARGQSAPQGLYDPDRIKGPLIRNGKDLVPTTWDEAIKKVAERLGGKSAKLLLISDLQGGTLDDVMSSLAYAWQDRMIRGEGGGAAVIEYEPLAYRYLAGSQGVFVGPTDFLPGEIPQYHLEKADLVVSFGADFLETWLSPVEFAGQFAQMRQVRDGKMGRFIYVGPRMSMTAANADQYMQLSPQAMPQFAMAVAKELARAKRFADTLTAKEDTFPSGGVFGNKSPKNPSLMEELEKSLESVKSPWGQQAPDAESVAAVAAALAKAKSPLVLAGLVPGFGDLSRDIATLAAVLNRHLGAEGKTVDDSRTHALGSTWSEYDLATPLSKVSSGDVVIIHRANLAFTMYGAGQRIRRAGTVVYMGTVMDETAELADVILPIDSPLEQWGDYVPYTDVHCIMQPAMRRLYDTRLPGDIVMSISADAGRPLSRKDGQSPPVDFREWLRLRWEEEILPKAQGLEGEDKWMAVLRVGVVIALPQEPEAATQPTTEPTTQPTTNPTPTNVYDVRDHMTVIPDFPKPVIDLEQGRRATPPGPREAWLWAYPSIMWFDGRTANRGWLQEAPDPVSYATWGSWIDIHPDKAKALGLVDNQVVRLESPVGKLEAPLRVTDQVSPDTVAIALGQGHTAAGMKTACGVGANPFLLIAPGLAGPTKVTIVGTDRKSPPVYTSATQDQHDRDILQWVSLAKVGQGPTEKFRLPLPSDYDPQHNIFDPHQKYARRWAMVIDLHKCIGCGACAVACYAENNISVMGAKWVDEGREMAWLKIVPYREKEESGRLGWLPMLCQQCDSAPCEPVCPVFASVHNFEGLNAQVYNRCIGTRYCNNNCPYKVRRFNWFDTNWEKPLDMQLNPDVTVRCRGVMEKCNFCIQRIRAVEIQAKVEGRAVRDEEVRLLPACAMSCPTRAIQLGDLMDRNSEVYKLTTTEARRYHVLEELNTKSAVTYLKRIKAD